MKSFLIIIFGLLVEGIVYCNDSKCIDIQPTIESEVKTIGIVGCRVHSILVKHSITYVCVLGICDFPQIFLNDKKYQGKYYVMKFIPNQEKCSRLICLTIAYDGIESKPGIFGKTGQQFAVLKKVEENESIGDVLKKIEIRLSVFK